MFASGNLIDAEARQKAEDTAKGVRRASLSPSALKRRLAKKKADQRKAKEQAKT